MGTSRADRKVVTMEHEETSPTPERAQHGELTRSPRQVPDANGDIGFPWRATGILAVMERRGSIDADMRKAGERFGRLFYAAHLDPIKAADMCRVPGLGGPVEGGEWRRHAELCMTPCGLWAGMDRQQRIAPGMCLERK